MITKEQYAELREYDLRTQFDRAALEAKYTDPFSGYPDTITHRADVVIAGAGPSGLMYGLYMQKHGFDVIIIEPHDIGHTTRDWNISEEEFMCLKCILDPDELRTCIIGRIPSKGYFNFNELFTYRSSDVLSCIIDPKGLLELLAKKIIEYRGKTADDIFIKSSYDNFKLKDDSVCVITLDGHAVEARLFLHGMGFPDEIFYTANADRPGHVYNIVGVNAQVGKTPLPPGDVLRTLEDANYSSRQQQLLWELFMSEEPESDHATIYLFTFEKEQASLEALMHTFEEKVYDYIQTDIKKVNHLLYGRAPSPDAISDITRSIAPRAYCIGENNGISPVTGCGFGVIIKTLDTIGTKLVKLLKKDTGKQSALSSRKLNRIKPSIRQLCSFSLEQLFKESMMRNPQELPDMPNKHCALLFSMFNLIRDEQGRNNMLKSRISPHFILEMLLRARKETSISFVDFLNLIAKNNRDLIPRIHNVARNYRELIFAEIGEFFKHLGNMILFRKGHLKKSYRHMKTVLLANPFQFYREYRYIVKQARIKEKEGD